MNKMLRIIQEEIQKLNEGDIDGSLWGLIKYNGGYFKSEKQRDFFHSKVKRQQQGAEKAGVYTGDDMVYASGGEVYGNSYTNFFYMDDQGITKVEKNTRKGGTKTTWERSDENTQKSQQAALNTNFHKAVKKYIDNYNEQYKQMKNQAIEKVREFHPKVSERDFDMVVDFATKGDLEKQTIDLKKIPTIANIPSMKALIYFGEVLLKMIEDGIAQPDGRTWGNFHPDFHITDLNSPEFGKLKPEFRTPEAKQAIIDKMG